MKSFLMLVFALAVGCATFAPSPPQSLLIAFHVVPWMLQAGLLSWLYVEFREIPWEHSDWSVKC